MSLGSTLAIESSERAERSVRARGMGDRPLHLKGSGELTPRLAQLVELVGRGATEKECARAMGITVSVVKVYRSAIYWRLGVTGQSQLRAWWLNREFQKWVAKYQGKIPIDALQELSSVFALAAVHYPGGERWTS